jgi:hypothetical protein
MTDWLELTVQMALEKERGGQPNSRRTATAFQDCGCLDVGGTSAFQSVALLFVELIVAETVAFCLP